MHRLAREPDGGTRHDIANPGYTRKGPAGRNVRHRCRHCASVDCAGAQCGARPAGPRARRCSDPSAAALRPFGSDFAENFDSYATGSQIHGQGGWKGWANDAGAGAIVDDAFAVSAPNAINITFGSDLLHEFSGYTAGVYTITARQCNPVAFAGRSYFIFENAYTDTLDPAVLSWSTQVAFDSSTGVVTNEEAAADPGEAPYVTGEWADLKLVVDLDADTQTFSYNGTEVYSGSWTQQFPQQAAAGSLNIASIDLFANGASPVYYDDHRHRRGRGNVVWRQPDR